MLGLAYHHHPVGLQGFHQAVGYLRHQFFLYLQAACEHFHQARQFGYAQHAPFGQIADADRAEKRL